MLLPTDPQAHISVYVYRTVAAATTASGPGRHEGCFLVRHPEPCRWWGCCHDITQVEKNSVLRPSLVLTGSAPPPGSSVADWEVSQDSQLRVRLVWASQPPALHRYF